MKDPQQKPGQAGLFPILMGVISLVWALITLLSGVGFSLPPGFHPQWCLATLMVIIFFQYYWIKNAPQTQEWRDFTTTRYALIIWIFASALTGAANQMGFLPFFFHQFVGWPFVIYFMWDALRVVRRRLGS